MNTELIQSNPSIMKGKPIIAGTDMPVALILEKLAAGKRIAQLVEVHPGLTEAGVIAALNFAAGALRADTVSPVDAQTDEIVNHPFPPTRPEVKIVESAERIYEVDCPELQWWFAIPQMGEHYFWAEYDAHTLKLDAVMEIISTAPATIQDINCVELRVREWLAPNDWPPTVSPDLMYAMLDETHTRWISVVKTIDGKRVFHTVGDEWFEEQWGSPTERRIVDDGRYQRQPDGSYKITEGHGLGAGTYDVTIGENTFHCLRVLDVEISDPHGGELAEVFIEKGGRTIFFRRYDGRYLRGHDLVSKFPTNRRIVINDIVYVHSDCSGWAHDQLTPASLCPAP